MIQILRRKKRRKKKAFLKIIVKEDSKVEARHSVVLILSAGIPYVKGFNMESMQQELPTNHESKKSKLSCDLLKLELKHRSAQGDKLKKKLKILSAS